MDYVREPGSRRKIAAVGAQIDSTQHDFARTGGDELLHFGDHNSGRQAAAAPSDKRNHAVGAAIVTSILNLQDRPSAIAFTNFRRRDLHGSLGEDVSR